MVDSLSTAITMGHVRIAKQILNHIAKIDFTTTARPNDQVYLFETTVHYLGGLISGMSFVSIRIITSLKLCRV